MAGDHRVTFLHVYQSLSNAYCSCEALLSTVSHWYQQICDMLRLLVLLLTNFRSSEILNSVLWSFLVSRWRNDDFDTRESLIPPDRLSDVSMN